VASDFSRTGHDRWSLKAEGLSAAGRQKRKHIAAIQRIIDDFLLQRPKFIVPEVFLKRRH